MFRESAQPKGEIEHNTATGTTQGWLQHKDKDEQRFRKTDKTLWLVSLEQVLLNADTFGSADGLSISSQQLLNNSLLKQSTLFFQPRKNNMALF
ncbi:hypothetical protein IFO70_14200 [Phormidium tenue FACHB-886]|nr:hypothetical protein [Phormidium tenue FACHB-886]